MLKKSGSYLLLFIFIGGLLGSIFGGNSTGCGTAGNRTKYFCSSVELGFGSPGDREFSLDKIYVGVSPQNKPSHCSGYVPRGLPL